MIEKMFCKLRRSRLKVVQEFGGQKSVNHVSFSLCAHTEQIAEAMVSSFNDIDQVEIVQGEIFDLDCEALVSPANSFGEMSGGLDKAIDNFYDGEAQTKAGEAIAQSFLGELPVGNALVLDMNRDRFPWLIVAPTMRIPGNVSSSINAYLSMRAVLVQIAAHNEQRGTKISSVAIPSLCTGVGGMNPIDSASQMRVAYDNIVREGWTQVSHPAMAPYAVRAS